jgi:hypothetical protein
VHELEAAPMGQNTKLIGTGMTGALVSIMPVRVVLVASEKLDSRVSMV